MILKMDSKLFFRCALITLTAFSSSCAHLKSDYSKESHLNSLKQSNTITLKPESSFVLDSEVIVYTKIENSKPVIDIQLPHSRNCPVYLAQDYPGYIYPEFINNSVEAEEPLVFVLHYDHNCMSEVQKKMGEQRAFEPITSRIDLYSQIRDEKDKEFKEKFLQGKIKISICRYFECSPLVGINEFRNPSLIFKTEFIPPKLISLNLNVLKKINPKTSLADAVFGTRASVCEGVLQQRPTLIMSLLSSPIDLKNAWSKQEFDLDTRYILRFYKGKIINRSEMVDIMKRGEVFCSLRVHVPKFKNIPNEKMAKKNKINMVILDTKIVRSSVAPSFYRKEDQDLLAFQYFSRSFELAEADQIKFANQTAYISGGFCSSPNEDKASGREVRIQDIYDNIPGVEIQTNFVDQQLQ